MESAKCSIKVGVSGQKGSSQRFVSSPCRPSGSRCESERKEGTAARDLGWSSFLLFDSKVR